MLDISAKHSIKGAELDKKIYSLKIIHNHKHAKKLAIWLLGMVFVGIGCMFLPWQQNIEGTGAVTAFTPKDRPQEVQTAIPGRIREWRVQEGQFVKQNDTLVVIDEIKDDYFDPELIQRLQEQLEAKKGGISATQNKISALDNQRLALISGLQFKLNQLKNKYEQATFKLVSDKADFEAEKANYLYYQRQSQSYDSLYFAKPVPLISQTEWEKRKQMLQESSAKVVSKQNKVFVAEQEMLNIKIELKSAEAEYQDKIAKSESDRSSAQGYLADATGEFSKLKNKYANVVVRNNQHFILAPQTGYIVKTLKEGVGETMKENEAICTIIPEKPQMAVELYIKAMDRPLVRQGRHVRLEFDGFPALQVSGYPLVAVGTFGGTVAVVDRVDSKEGKFRILVIPTKEEPWPAQLNVGSGVYGWIMLDNVSVGYEIWRQLNGFPASLYTSNDAEDYEKKKGKDDEEKEKKKKSGNKIKVKVKK